MRLQLGTAQAGERGAGGGVGIIKDTCKRELWHIPRNCSVVWAAKRCHVRLFLRDLRYVSDVETDENTEMDWLKG